MELLIGACVSVVAEIVKLITKKFGKELARAFLVILVFLLSVAGGAVYLWLKDSAGWENLVVIWATAIGIYEVLLKSIVYPIVGRFFKKTA